MRNNIAEIRKKMSLTQDELADALGVNRSTICRYENGHIDRIPYTHCIGLAQALGCTTETLFGIAEKDLPDAITKLIDDEIEMHRLFASMPEENQQAILRIARAMVS